MFVLFLKVFSIESSRKLIVVKYLPSYTEKGVLGDNIFYFIPVNSWHREPDFCLILHHKVSALVCYLQPAALQSLATAVINKLLIFTAVVPAIMIVKCVSASLLLHVSLSNVMKTLQDEKQCCENILLNSTIGEHKLIGDRLGFYKQLGRYGARPAYK